MKCILNKPSRTFWQCNYVMCVNQNIELRDFGFVAIIIERDMIEQQRIYSQSVFY